MGLREGIIPFTTSDNKNTITVSDIISLGKEYEKLRIKGNKMRKITKEEIEVIEKYDIQFNRKEGFILNYDSSDVPVISIFNFLISTHRMHILEGEDGKVFAHIHHDDVVFEKRQFKNANIGNKYLFHDGEQYEKIYSKLSKIDYDSEKPFITTLGNSFKYIEEKELS